MVENKKDLGSVKVRGNVSNFSASMIPEHAGMKNASETVDLMAKVVKKGKPVQAIWNEEQGKYIEGIIESSDKE